MRVCVCVRVLCILAVVFEYCAEGFIGCKIEWQILINLKLKGCQLVDSPHVKWNFPSLDIYVFDGFMLLITSCQYLFKHRNNLFAFLLIIRGEALV